MASASAASRQEDDEEDDVKMVMAEAEGPEEEDETGIGHLKAWFRGTLLIFLCQVLNQSSESNHLVGVVGSYFHHQGQNREGWEGGC